MVGGRLRGSGWRGEEGFGVAREVLTAIGTVEAFGKDDDFCAGL